MLARWYDLQRKEAGKGIKVLNGFITDTLRKLIMITYNNNNDDDDDDDSLPSAVFIAVIRPLRCHDSDDNENIKKAIGSIGKTTPVCMHHAFLYISLLSLHDYNRKMPNFSCYGRCKQMTFKFSFSVYI